MNDSGTILNMHLVGWFILFLRQYINWILRKLQMIKDGMIRNDSFWEKLQQGTVSCFKIHGYSISRDLTSDSMAVLPTVYLLI